MLHARKWWAKKEDLVVGDTTFDENAHVDTFK